MDSPCSSPGRGLTATILGTKSDDYTATSVGRLCGFGEVNFEIDAEAIGVRSLNFDKRSQRTIL
jgi:hypothetical protein